MIGDGHLKVVFDAWSKISKGFGGMLRFLDLLVLMSLKRCLLPDVKVMLWYSPAPVVGCGWTPLNLKVLG